MSQLPTFDAIYFEPDSLNYPLGQTLKEKYENLPWIPVESHNRIDELRRQPNSQFARMKRLLVIGTRKTHKYTENQKISDYLVPYTSSGCTASCLYCYLVCNYNKCSYLRLFVNREKMLDRLCAYSRKQEQPKTFEIGSNSDLVLENAITGNLEWTIPAFARQGKGYLTFPTKFHTVDNLLPLDHQGRTIFRMSLNPPLLIRRTELGTSTLEQRLQAVEKMSQAGYPCGILIAPVMLVDGWQDLYTELLNAVADTLSARTLKSLTVEVIFMTYSFIHRAINQEAFPNALELYDKTKMKGRGRGKYCYYGPEREMAEDLLREQIAKKLPTCKLIYMC